MPEKCDDEWIIEGALAVYRTDVMAWKDLRKRILTPEQYQIQQEALDNPVINLDKFCTNRYF